MRQFRLFIITAFLLLSQLLVAQTGTIRGFVYDKNSSEPMLFTSVYLMGTTFGTSTDQNGYFSLGKVPLGKYRLLATSIGYDSSIVEINLERNGQIIDQKLFISDQGITLDETVITAELQEAKTEVKMSLAKLTPKLIKKLPSIGGEPDLAQYLQVLPGVVFTGDQGGQLYIRGGSPIQNMVLLDGMLIYNPFHSIGLFSVFDTDILRTADVYTGGFNAEYGGRISSVMDITTRDGNKQRLAGKIAASTFGAKALIEGPLQKAKTPGGGTKTFLISAKNSYLRETAPTFYDYADTNGLPFNFTDIYAKVSLNGSNGSKVNFFGYNFTDNVDYPNVAKYEWNSSGGGANFVLIPGTSPVLIDGVFAFSSYESSINESELTADARDRRSEISGFNMGMNFTNFFGKNESKYGFEIWGNRTDFSFENSVNQTVEQVQNTTELAVYYRYKLNIKDKLIFEPSMRLHYYSSLATMSPEPRLGFKYNVSDRFRIKGAAGLFSQNLMSATSDRDVVNLFYGFLSGPDNLPDDFVDENGEVKEVNSALQRARHLIFGFEVDLFKYFNVNIEGYYKDFNQLTNINRNKLYEDIQENADIPDVLKKDFIIETGDAYGIDFAFKYERKQLSVNLVYSLSKVTRWDGLISYPPIFDRRHNVNFLASYTFGKDLEWSADARWNLGSGFPFTQTSGFYELLDFQDGLNTDYVNSNGDLGIRYGNLNGGRMPFYHRMDLSLKRRFVLTENSILEATASVTNAYDRNNIFYVNRVTNERVDQLPILPSVGMSLTF